MAVTLPSIPGFYEYNAYIPMITFFFPGGEDNPRVPHARMVGQEGRGGKFLSQASFLLFKKKRYSGYWSSIYSLCNFFEKLKLKEIFKNL